MDKLTLFESELKILKDRFSEIFLKARANNLNEQDINDALDIIKDEKFIFRQPKLVLKKISFLKDALKKSRVKIPNELYYREAAVYFEFKNEIDFEGITNPEKSLQKSLELFSEIFNNSIDSDIYKEYSAFFIIRIYLKFYNLDHDSHRDNSTITQNDLYKAESFIMFLTKKYINRSLSQVVSFSYGDLITRFEQLRKNNSDIIINNFKLTKIIRNNKTTENISERDSYEYSNNNQEQFHIFIDATRDIVFINSRKLEGKQRLNENQLKLLSLFILEDSFNSGIVEDIFDIEHPAAHRRIVRMQEYLRKKNIIISDEFIFGNEIKVAIFYNNNDKRFLENIIYTQ